MTDDASKWKTAVNASLLGMAGHWAKQLEAELPPESGVLVIMYNKVGDPAHVVTMTLNDEHGRSLKILHEVERLLVERVGTDEREFTATPLGAPPINHLISSAKVSALGAHDLVRLWNRGGLAGELVVNHGDGDTLCAVLGMVNVAQRAVYQRQLQAMVVAAAEWRQAHPSAQLVMDWPGLVGGVVLGSLKPYIGTIGGNAASRTFLEALDVAADGCATILMAQAAYEATAA